MHAEEFRFALHTRVRLVEIERPAVITAIRVDDRGHSYLVAYWNDGQRKEEWCYEWELRESE